MPGQIRPIVYHGGGKVHAAEHNRFMNEQRI